MPRDLHGEMEKHLRLMIGSGIHKREGWQTLDCNPKHRPDYLTVLPPVPLVVQRQQWQEIEWVHGITSLYPWEAVQVLHELFHCIAPGGKLVLEQPDLFFVVRQLGCGGGLTDWLFGDPTPRDPAHMNKWSYTPPQLTKILKDVGFSKVWLKPAMHHNPVRDFRLEAVV